MKKLGHPPDVSVQIAPRERDVTSALRGSKGTIVRNVLLVSRATIVNNALRDSKEATVNNVPRIIMETTVVFTFVAYFL